jgi:catechol 2,3-dioxygenase-like lactoylglutathione lyase family enzyme
MVHYVSVKVSDLERSAAFYDAILSPLGWRRHEDGSGAIGWGMVRPVFFISRSDSPRPGYGQVSFPAKSIPAVRASFEAGVENGGRAESEPGSAPLHGSANYCARLIDPDGHTVELSVAPE